MTGGLAEDEDEVDDDDKYSQCVNKQVLQVLRQEWQEGLDEDKNYKSYKNDKYLKNAISPFGGGNKLGGKECKDQSLRHHINLPFSVVLIALCSLNYSLHTRNHSNPFVITFVRH